MNYNQESVYFFEKLKGAKAKFSEKESIEFQKDRFISREVLNYLIEYCHSNTHKSDFNKILFEKLAVGLNKVTSVDKAKEYLNEIEENIRKHSKTKKA